MMAKTERQINREIMAQDEQANARELWLREIALTRRHRPYRTINAVQISVDHGNTWKLAALCTECVSKIEPPHRAKPAGAAASLNCDRCDALNIEYKGK